MIIIDNIEELQAHLKKSDATTIGFVPTMGSLHEGHLSLIKKAKSENEKVVVSIFVNPTQFLAGEDLDKYPRKDLSDKKWCELCGVDFLFMPNISTLYDEDEVLIKAPKKKSYILEGERRAGHFDGVLQVVLKLFHIVSPTKAYFGKKDAQQLLLIEQMVQNFYLDIMIVACDIVREPDGLAFSSRNVYLTPEERIEALKISQAIQIGAKSVGNGILIASQIKKKMEDLLQSEKIEIEYIAITNRKLQNIEEVVIHKSIILVAVKIGTTRLIDNIWI